MHDVQPSAADLDPRGDTRAPCGSAPILQVTEAANAVLRRVGIFDNAYFSRLADGSMSLESFRASQEQFFYAVQYFPRPMSALLARLPHPQQRLDLLHNIVEEHGDFQPARFHANTFRAFLASVGARSPDDPQVRMGPPVHAFNNVLMAACMNDDVVIGIACLGIIEHAFAEISARIGRAVVQRGWVPHTALQHYATHAELDQRHAEEFFAMIEPQWESLQSREIISQGLELGAYAFDQLYRTL